RQQYTQMVNDAIEAEIRRYPAGWLWIHDRWKQD
ncbi:MAG: lipid A biosynthesis acyltransferase, partial [Abditibacteriota bacterium]|nr:lipid A biosynthesis acyltransferase [Abditibacteriota bacterium]